MAAPVAHRRPRETTLSATRRRQICTDYQGNRNPYVDYPELVAAVFDDAEEAQIRADACNDDPQVRTTLMARAPTASVRATC